MRLLASSWWRAMDESLDPCPCWDQVPGVLFPMTIDGSDEYKQSFDGQVLVEKCDSCDFFATDREAAMFLSAITGSTIKRWYDVGITDRKTITLWHDAGFHAEEAGQWNKARFSLKEAQSWQGKKFTAMEAEDWRDKGFSLKEAEKLRKRGLTADS